MSIRVMTRVWADAPYGGGALLLMLAIADFADDSGFAFPKVAVLAKKIRMTRSHTQALLKALEADGAIKLTHSRGRGRGNQFWIADAFYGKGEKFRPFAKRQNGRAKTSEPTSKMSEPTHITPVKEPSLVPSGTVSRIRDLRSRDTGLRSIGEVIRNAASAAS